MAVTLNGRLDYLGTTVNMAARLQGESRGGDVVLSEAVAADADVAALLQGLDCARETTTLKGFDAPVAFHRIRSEEHTSELQSLMRNSYAVFCLKKIKNIPITNITITDH